MSNEQEDRRLIGALLRIPFQTLVTQIHERLTTAGYSDLRPAHYVVFQHMRPEGIRLTELAEQAQLTKQSMGYLVDSVQERGYVERVPDPADRRAKIVRYTERGWEVDRVARQIVRAIESEWACRLGEPQMQQLRHLLKELIATLEQGNAH